MSPVGESASEVVLKVVVALTPAALLQYNIRPIYVSIYCCD